MQNILGFFGRASIAAGRLVCLRSEGQTITGVRAIKHRDYWLAGALRLPGVPLRGGADTAAAAGHEPPDAAQAKTKLAAVRARIAELTGRLGLELKQRDALNARLREADLGSPQSAGGSRRCMRGARGVERRRNELRRRFGSQSRMPSRAERAALAAQVRAQYMIGRADEMQTSAKSDQPRRGRPHADLLRIFRARARGENRGDRRSRGAPARTGHADIEATAANLKSLKEETGREVAGLRMRARSGPGAVAAHRASKCRAATRSSRGSNARSRRWNRLVADLAQVLQDFPVDSEQSFDQLRGKLPWPVAGK